MAGLGIEKIPGGKSTEASETQTTEDDGEKKTSKTSKSSTAKQTTQAAIEVSLWRAVDWWGLGRGMQFAMGK